MRMQGLQSFLLCDNRICRAAASGASGRSRRQKKYRLFRTALMSLAVLFLAVTGRAQVLTYSQAFTNFGTPTTQCTAWETYRASLLSSYSYTKMTMRGSLNTTGVSLTNPTLVAAVANAIRTGTNYGPFTSDGRSWLVSVGCGGSCGSPAVELISLGSGATASFCSCPSGDAYLVRPNIGNYNWGGIGQTCEAPSQTLEVIFYAGCPSISGATNMCTGTTTTLTNPTAGGTWTSSNTAVGTISSSGVLTGISPGSTTITYAFDTCVKTHVVTVSASPAAITGTSSACVGGTSTLSSASAGGTWLSSNTGIASVNTSTGVVTGVSSGSCTISYMVGSCFVTQAFTVSGAPSISGSSSVCMSNTTSLSASLGGGTWSSTNTAVGTISTGGVFAGVTAGTTTVSYSLGGSCFATRIMTVTALPSIGAGSNVAICNGSSTTLTGTGGGNYSWSPATGLSATTGTSVTASPTVTTTYTVTGSTGGSSIIYSQAFSSASPGGGGSPQGIAWNIFRGNLVSTNVYSGFTIRGTYSPTGVTCTNPTVAQAIAAALRVGYNYDGSSDGHTWHVRNCGGWELSMDYPCNCAATYVLRPENGGYYGAAGTTSCAPIPAQTLEVVFTIGGGAGSCTNTATVTVSVNPVPTVTAVSSGTVCVGSTIDLTSSISGGSWVSGNTSVATVNSSGVVTGVAAGTCAISYIAAGCTGSMVVTVSAAPVISGASSVCTGSTITLTSTSGGGSWTSDNTSIATVSAAGVVTGVASGSVTISYMIGSCVGTTSIMVNNTPAITSEISTVCAGSTITLSSSVSGGSWFSGNTSVATVNSSGVVTGVAAGTSAISYSAAGCTGTMVVTVSATPVISGASSVCTGSTITLTSTSGGGSWTSDNTSIATVSASGVVTGVASGSVIITYMIGSCVGTTSIMVNSTPAITSEISTVCVGNTITLTASISGGSWFSGSTGVATVVSGEVTGVSAGTALISYYASGCLSTATVTVNALPTITTEESVYVCIGATYTLTASPSGGTWGSSDVAAATVGMTSGIVTGVATGSSSISYTVAGCVSEPFHVGVLPATEAPTVEGASTVCVGSSISLSGSTESGSWSSSNTSVATVEGGMVSGVSGGTAAITYSVTGDCGTAYDVHMVTVISLPAAISGPSSVCVGSTITLTSSPAGGTWSTGGDAVSVDASTGVVTGVTAGTATVTYTAPSGCYVTTDITVEELPEAISGTTSVCVGSTTPLSSAPGGGTWTSSNTSRATVDGDAITPGGYTALVTGVSPGTVSISYTLSTGCRRKVTVTVLATPSAITGSLSLCSGSTTTLSSATTGGSWSSSDEAAATIDAGTGVVTGAGTGTTTIMYTIGGCSASAVVTVAGSLTASTGSSVVCVGGSIALSNTTSGGAWSSSDVAIATVTSSGGVVTGVSSGVVSITYTAGAGCYTITNMTVNAAVSSITGTMSVCPGLTTTLSNATSGGSWSSSNVAVATVDAGTGVVTGVSGGTVTISYIVSAGCSQSAVVTVLSSPAGISGTAVVCEGSTTTLTCSPGGGTWSSSGSAATVGSTGIVTGVSAGSANVYYTNASGCSSAITVTVNAVPASITGTLSVCVGSTSSLSSTTTGGTWVATFPTRATVNSTTGLVTGLAAGTTPVIYTAGGCSTTSTVTVSSTPSAIGGTLTVCIGSTTTLTSATTGGTWTSSNGSVATIVSGTGVVTGVGTGAATIAYSNGTCATTAIVTVNSALGANTGVTTVCAGSGTTLSNATTGGTWSTSNASVATVNTTTGLVAGVSGGTVNISYNVGAGCFSVTEVTVNTSLSSITGTTTVCPGATTTLSHGDAGGAWSSGNTARATVVSGTGVVTGVTTGTVFITYTLGGCFATTLVSVNASPGAITGTASMCVGLTTALSSSPSGGTWSSADPATASISGGGVVTGVMAGNATISYQNAAGCVTTRVVTVSASAGTIGGTLSTCIGTTTTLTAAGGGSWSSTNTLRATIGSATGMATGVSAGTVIISYALSASCVSTAVLTVTAVPSITGTALICAICTSTLTGTPSGGTWTSSVPARATIGASSGIVSGVSAGTTTMSYVAGGCLSTRIVTVNPSTSPSFGTPVVCVGQTNSTLSNPVPGGTWSSSNTSIATVHAANGLLTGVGVGNANITYTTSPGSWTIIVATVGALVANNVGTLSICPSTTTPLTNATAGGTWLSTNTAIATVGNLTGIVTGVTTGTSSISYEVNVGCYRVSTVTVKSVPNIGGTATTVPIGGTRTLTGSPAGGTWSSANIAIATVSGTGVVGGVSVGGTTITYTNSAGFGGCFRTRPMTVTLTRPGGPVVGETSQAGVLKVFPNPTSGSLTIDAPVAGTFTVYTIDGKEVAQYAVTASANMVTLPSNLAAGIYMSRFMGSDGTSTVVRLVYEQK
jgi:uncharacterized protein YjdB